MLESKSLIFKFPRDPIANRGRLNMLFDMAVIASLETANKTGKRGKPFVYSDTLIISSLVVRNFYNLPFRMASEILVSIIECLGVSMSAPDYSTIYYRSKKQKNKLQLTELERESNVVVDGEGVHSLPVKSNTINNSGWHQISFDVDEARREIVLDHKKRFDAVISDLEQLKTKTECRLHSLSAEQRAHSEHVRSQFG